MILFRTLQLSDKPCIEALLAGADSPICDHTYANIYMWQPTYLSDWAEVEGMLVVRYRIDGQWAHMVAGQGDFNAAMEALIADVESRGEALRLVSISRQDVERFKSWLALSGRSEYDYAIYNSRDYQDYIYSLEDLSTLVGRKYQPKRNHVNRFESRYEYRFEPLRREHFEECLRLECRWQRSKGETDCTESREQEAIRRAFDAYEELELLGGVLIVDGHIVAFTFGSAINEKIFCTHIEKGDTRYEGVFPMINRCFAQLLLQRGYELVNREEDMGLAGLRRSKLSYYPTLLQEKMGVKALRREQIQCRRLWMEVFGDEREEVDRFLAEYSDEHNMLLHREQGCVVSMLHIVDMATDYGPTAYLYAIATASEWRGRGFASELIGQAISLARERGYRAVMLIPSEESLVEYYEQFGFAAPCYKLDFSNGYDFGTGDKERDIAMVLTL